MPEDDLSELALAFAKAVVKPGGNALVLDATNRRSGWVPIQEAVASGHAFAVEPCDHVVAVDIDDENDRAWAARVRAGLAPLGCHFVLVNSGREGHQHLWVLTPPGWTYEYIKARMEEVAGTTTWSQVRSMATRPPFAPHRLGGRSSIVEPGAATALNLFRAHRPQPLSDAFRFGSVWLDPQVRIEKRGQVDRGRTIHRVALMLVNARRSQQDFERLIRADDNDVTSKYWNMPSDRRQAAVDLWWKRACEYVRANPPKAANRGVVEGLMADVPVMDWRSRSGANDRAVYQALLETGHKAGSLTVDASIRRLSELTNLSTGGVQAALGRLVDDGFIARADEPDRAHGLAGSFVLLVEVPRRTDVCRHTWSFLGGTKAMCAEEVQVLADLFANPPGLGLSTRETWEVLPEQPTKTSEVVALLGGTRKHATVRAHLKKLVHHGLAGRLGNRWWRLRPSVDDLRRLALQLGVHGKANRRRARYERERAEYRSFLGQPSSGQAL